MTIYDHMLTTDWPLRSANQQETLDTKVKVHPYQWSCNRREASSLRRDLPRRGIFAGTPRAVGGKGGNWGGSWRGNASWPPGAAGGIGGNLGGGGCGNAAWPPWAAGGTGGDSGGLCGGMLHGLHATVQPCVIAQQHWTLNITLRQDLWNELFHVFNISVMISDNHTGLENRSCFVPACQNKRSFWTPKRYLWTEKKCSGPKSRDDEPAKARFCTNIWSFQTFE